MLVVVGGHSRNIGKTSLMCGLIQALAHLRWQAFKITQHGHSVCNNTGDPCDCAPNGATHPYAIDQQHKPDATDTGRYLKAGAAQSWWVRTAQGELAEALPVLRERLAASEHNIVESNSLLRYLRPDLYIVVVNFDIEDRKDSARLFLDRADAFVVTGGHKPWSDTPARWFEGKPTFRMDDMTQLPEGLAEWVSGRLDLRPDAIPQPLRLA